MILEKDLLGCYEEAKESYLPTVPKNNSLCSLSEQDLFPRNDAGDGGLKNMEIPLNY